MADAFDAQFIVISAVLGGVKDIREAVVAAQAAREQGRATILFVDEVHRFNKAQQDGFLPHVESGLFTFIGATTENPSFEVNGALLSRARVYVLQPLSAEEMGALFERALERLAEPGQEPGAPSRGAPGHLAPPATAGAGTPDSAVEAVPSFDAAARERLVGWADGDARRLINAIEVVVEAARAQGRTAVDAAYLEQALSQNLRRFDKGGEAFYDQISALHKTVRGSHPDAALYWFCRMLDGGADPRYLARVSCGWPAKTSAWLIRARHRADAAEVYERLARQRASSRWPRRWSHGMRGQVQRGHKVTTRREFVKSHGSAPVPIHRAMRPRG
jgi:putative ATPase